MESKLSGETLTVAVLPGLNTQLLQGDLGGDLQDAAKETALLLELLSSRLGFNYTTIHPSSTTTGIKLDNGSWTGILGLVVDNKADVALARIPNLPLLDGTVELSLPYGSESWVTLQQPPLETISATGLLIPFNYVVWILVALSVLGMAPIMYLFYRLQSFLMHDRCQYVRGTWDNFAVFVVVSLLRQDHNLNMKIRYVWLGPKALLLDIVVSTYKSNRKRNPASNKRQLCTFFITERSYYSVAFGLAFPKGSPYKDYFNKELEALDQSGITTFLRINSSAGSNPCVFASSFEVRPLTVQDFLGLFIVTGLGFILAAVAFSSENCVKMRKALSGKIVPAIIEPVDLTPASVPDRGELYKPYFSLRSSNRKQRSAFVYQTTTTVVTVAVLRSRSMTDIGKLHEDDNIGTKSKFLKDEYTDLEVQLGTPKDIRPKPDISKLVFGKFYTDHMFEVAWEDKSGWGKPLISPLHNLPLHPGAKVLHYATELFEGMKAYRGVDGRIRLFRPDCNMERLLMTAKRASLPTFNSEEMIRCIKKLIQVDQEWVPHSESSSLYIRPTLIGTEPTLGVATPNSALLYVLLCPVGPYFASGFKPISLMADPQYVRAWPGGCGDAKMGSNYAPTIRVQKMAEKQGHQQVLWLFGEDHQLTEAGTMNIFVYMVNEQGEKELITPPLNGLILPGVTRRCFLELARKWGEFKVTERVITMAEMVKAHKESRLLEVFGAGTACVICPIANIGYQGENISIPTMEHAKPLNQRFLEAMNDIQYGRISHPWGVLID
nr:EOG090X051P [Lepidurus arcticus]